MRLAALAAAAAVSMPAGATAGGWVLPQPVAAAPEGVWSPIVDLDGRGGVRGLWVSLDSGGYSSALHTALLDPETRTWSAATTLASGGVGHYDLDVNADGDAVVAWTPKPGADQQVFATVWLRESASWSDVKQLSSAPGGDAGYPAVGIDGGGTAIVVWHEEAADGSINSAVLRPGAAEWDRRPVSGDHELTTFFRTPDVAVAPDGRAVAVWSAGSYSWVLEAAVYVPGSGWQTPTTISAPDEVVSSPVAAMDERGNAVVAWEHGKYHYPWTQIWVTTLPAGGAWEAPTRVSAGRGQALYPAVAVDVSGIDVAWTIINDSDGRDRIETATRDGFRGGWGAATPLRTPELMYTYSRPGRPTVARRSDGAGLIGWGSSLFSTSGSVVRVALRPPGGEWGEGVIVSPRDTSTSRAGVAWTHHGDPLAVWSRGTDTTPYRMEYAVYDSVAPEIASLLIPSQAREDELVTFSVVAVDRWAGIGTPRWHLGYDNLVYTGATASWDYPRPGRYTVRVVVPDGVGNEVVREQAIDITAVPARPPVAARRCRVPRVTGKTVKAARRLLTRADCRLGKVTRAWSRRVAAGRIIRQRPRSGTRLPRRARVAVVVSRGRRR